MLVGNIDFYSDDEKCCDFMYALCVQYFRTKQLQEAIISQARAPIVGADIGRCGAFYVTFAR